jgi:hypothetical protein
MTTEHEISRLKAAPGYLSGKLNPFPERLPATQATEIAEKLIRAYLLDVGAGMDDYTQHEVEFSEKIAAAIGAAAQAPALSVSALEIAERFRLFFRRPYPMSEEGVERAVQALAQEIEAAIRHNEARPGPRALEATRDLFQSLDGWRPTDDWTGVPPRLKLAFDRTLHAIKAAEARGRERL